MKPSLRRKLVLFLNISWKNKSWNIGKGGCECNGNLNPINKKGECEYRATTGCGLWSTSSYFRQLTILFPKKFLQNFFYRNVNRWYVDKLNTCQDAKPSISRPGWFWSCEACDTPKNGRAGYPINSWRKKQFLSLPTNNPAHARFAVHDRQSPWVGRVMKWIPALKRF